jgi:hypothetical protein
VFSKDLHTLVSAFDNISSGMLYIFNGSPVSTNLSAGNVTGPAGELPINDSYTYHWSQEAPYSVPGGSIEFLDTTAFHIASNISAVRYLVRLKNENELNEV